MGATAPFCMMQYRCLLILGLQLEIPETSVWFFVVASNHRVAVFTVLLLLRKALNAFQLEVFDRHLLKEKQKLKA